LVMKETTNNMNGLRRETHQCGYPIAWGI